MIASAEYTDGSSDTIKAVIDSVVHFIPNVMGNRHRQLIAIWEADGNTITAYSATLTAAEKIIGMTAIVQSVLDTEARKLGYDDIFTAISYATSSDSVYGPQGVAFRNWRDSVWNAAHSLLNTWQTGGAEPTASEVVAALPSFTAP